MSTEMPSELELFQQYVSDRLASGPGDNTLDETIAGFRAYQQQLDDLRDKVREATDESARGESGAFDAEASKRRLRERLAREGNAEKGTTR